MQYAIDPPPLGILYFDSEEADYFFCFCLHLSNLQQECLLVRVVFVVWLCRVFVFSNHVSYDDYYLVRTSFFLSFFVLFHVVEL